MRIHAIALAAAAALLLASPVVAQGFGGYGGGPDYGGYGRGPAAPYGYGHAPRREEGPARGFGYGRDQPAGPQAGGAIVGRASVIDGDTLDIHGTRVRLFGIDAPESSQTCGTATGGSWRCGQEAAAALDRRLMGKVVSCETRDVDRYGRTVAVCREGGTDLNAWMVSQGLAVAYVRYGADYAGAEAQARSRRAGIWAGPFQNPADYRAENRGGQRGGYRG